MHNPWPVHQTAASALQKCRHHTNTARSTPAQPTTDTPRKYLCILLYNNIIWLRIFFMFFKRFCLLMFTAS